MTWRHPAVTTDRDRAQVADKRRAHREFSASLTYGDEVPRIPLPRTRRGRLLSLAAVVVILAAAGAVWATSSGGQGPAVATQDKIIDVPAAPGSAEKVQL